MPASNAREVRHLWTKYPKSSRSSISSNVCANSRFGRRGLMSPRPSEWPLWVDSASFADTLANGEVAPTTVIRTTAISNRDGSTLRTLSEALLRVPHRECVDYRATGFTRITAAHCIRQHALHSAEVRNLRPNVRKVTGRELARFGANVRWGFPPFVQQQLMVGLGRRST